jgi:hypothetical protein
MYYSVEKNINPKAFMIIVSQFLQFYRSKLKFQSDVKKDGPHPNIFEISTNDGKN